MLDELVNDLSIGVSEPLIEKVEAFYREDDLYVGLDIFEKVLADVVGV